MPRTLVTLRLGSWVLIGSSLTTGWLHAQELLPAVEGVPDTVFTEASAEPAEPAPLKTSGTAVAPLDPDPVGPQLSLDPGNVGEEEVIRERYPNGSVRVERTVIQDEQQNYINHGSWKMWDEAGQPLCQGQYRLGQRHGPWRRYYKANEATLFSAAPYNLFAPPYRSEAEFVNGQLSGTWRIVDGEERKICEWEFLDGRRNGKSVWWYPNGQPMREINYASGMIEGEILEWDQQGRIVTQDKFLEGRRLVERVENYPSGQKESAGMLLYPKLILKQADDWWECRLAQYEQSGKSEKHGKWTVWYENGQKKVEGTYEHDQPQGKFVWWHANGQKALEGEYAGSRKLGIWTWWHDNGQKSIQGEYASGTPQGPWTWWEQSGKVAQRAEFTGGQARVIAKGSAPLESVSPRTAPTRIPSQGRNPSAQMPRGQRK